jgi:hypothetical protein
MMRKLLNMSLNLVTMKRNSCIRNRGEKMAKPSGWLKNKMKKACLQVMQVEVMKVVKGKREDLGFMTYNNIFVFVI